MNVDKWISDIIASRERCTVPIMTHPGIEMIGATVKDAVLSGEKHAQAINELSKKYPSKAATVIMDLTVEAEAFGCSIAFPENDMPHILPAKNIIPARNKMSPAKKLALFCMLLSKKGPP